MMVDKPKVLKKGGKPRDGRGFSRSELKQVGSYPKEALRLRIPLDVRRKTAHEENVATLKKLLESRKAASKPKGKPKS